MFGAADARVYGQWRVEVQRLARHVRHAVAPGETHETDEAIERGEERPHDDHRLSEEEP
jgi:hypothetical protein